MTSRRCPGATSLTVTEDRFGVLEDEKTGERHAVRRFALDSGRGLSFQVVTLGAAVTALSLPDRRGAVEDIVLGFDSLQDYVEHSTLSLSGVMGRVSGRVGGASFRLGENIHFVTENDGHHHRDGGVAAFHKALWEAKMLEDGVLLSHVSGDGAGGFPGAVLAEVSYRLPRDSVLPELWVDMTAVATAPTPLDMSLALPFNLAGHVSHPLPRLGTPCPT
ncbi:galactose mutarotase-like [Schistocerca gregaria]|uniref:galactose mutarotase-like n=1 Tax=Schistocerca gregaria TaxID=7010 RepID=UPI00211EFC64|nr:galactose mutarotase-like [Schistocerca gregaria]